MTSTLKKKISEREKKTAFKISHKKIVNATQTDGFIKSFTEKTKTCIKDLEVIYCLNLREDIIVSLQTKYCNIIIFPTRRMSLSLNEICF